MKKGDLAAAAAERMGGRGWLPPALVIAEPEPAAEDEPAPVADGDGDHEEFAEAKAARCAGRAGRQARLRIPASSSPAPRSAALRRGDMGVRSWRYRWTKSPSKKT